MQSTTIRTFVLLALSLLPAAVAGFAQVTPDIANVEPAQGRFALLQDSWVYKGPSLDSEHLKEVRAPHHVLVSGATRDFVQVHLRDGTTGYIPQTVLALFRPADKTLVLSTDAGVYAGPHFANARIATVHRGQNVHVIGVELYYLKIRTDDGVEGFIPDFAAQ